MKECTVWTGNDGEMGEKNRVAGERDGMKGSDEMKVLGKADLLTSRALYRV